MLCEAERGAAMYDDHNFDAQQAAEKAIKAIFIARGGFPYVHVWNNCSHC